MENNSEIERFKIKRLVKKLGELRGNGTSVITLILSSKDDINKANKMLTDEYGTAQNIKSRVNRLSVLGAITSTQQRLKLYKKTPPNGLVVFCGEILTDEGKEKKLAINFEPFKPITSSMYLCDNRFHTENLNELLENNESFGFVIINGQSCLFAKIEGNNQNILQILNVSLPKKHNKGGQSAARFFRLRLEKRHAYLTKVAELCAKHFITNDKPNVKGIIIGGSAEFKDQLSKAEFLDKRLSKSVLKIVDINYGERSGLNQAINLSSECLTDLKFVKEKKLLSEYFENIAKETDKICYGLKDVFYALETGAVETLIIWEDIPYKRYVMKTKNEDEEYIKFLTPEDEENKENFLGLKTEQCDSLADWFAENYKQFGCNLEIISDKTTEGSQFCKGFGGIGAILRYQVEFHHELSENEEESEDEDLDEYFM